MDTPNSSDQKIGIPERVHDALWKVLDYSLHEEEKHFDCNPSPDHIYVSLKIVKNWLEHQPVIEAEKQEELDL